MCISACLEDICKSILTSWKRRNLSLLAKILVINSLIASLFIYKMSVLPKIPTKIINEFNKIIQDFLWNGGRPKIALKTLQSNKKDGGANLIDLEVKDEAMKAMWVIRISENAYLRQLAFRQLDPFMQEWIFRANINVNDIQANFKDSFWRDVLIAWSRYAYKEKLTGNEILAQLIWYNSHIKSDGKILKSKKAVRNGLLRIIDLVCEETDRLLSPNEISDKFNIDIMLANTVITALPKSWKKELSKPNIFPAILPYEELVLVNKPTKVYYNARKNSDTVVFSKYVKWQAKLHTELSYSEFVQLFKKINLATNHTKLCSFQYRLLNYSLITNTLLKTWGIKENDSCEFCEKELETPLHILWECEKVQKVWGEISVFIKNLTNFDVQLSPEKVIFNTVHANPKHVSNFVVLAAKAKIYALKCKQETLSVIKIKSFIEECKNIEKFNALKKNKLDQNIKKWSGIVINRKNNLPKIEELSLETYAKQYISQINTL